MFALAAFISAAVVLGVIEEENFRLRVLGDIVDSTEGAAGWVICLSVFTMVAELHVGFIALLCLQVFSVVTLDSEMFIFYNSESCGKLLQTALWFPTIET